MPFKVVIVDDEPLAREYLKSLLSEDEEIEIVAICTGGKEAVQSIKKLAPEIVFLDVQMPGLDGFGVIHSIGASAMPAIIFVTAFDKYAIQAFETHAADYLLKPFDRERLIKALDHVKKEIRSRKTGGDLAKRLQEILVQYEDHEVSASSGKGISGGQYVERIPIKTVDKSYIVKTLDIDWIETADTYLVLHARGKQHVLRETMKWAETHLDPNRFFRIHRQAIVNIDKIKELQAGWQGSFRVLLEDGTQLQLSRRRRRDLENFSGDPFRTSSDSPALTGELPASKLSLEILELEYCVIDYQIHGGSDSAKSHDVEECPDQFALRSRNENRNSMTRIWERVFTHPISYLCVGKSSVLTGMNKRG